MCVLYQVSTKSIVRVRLMCLLSPLYFLVSRRILKNLEHFECLFQSQSGFTHEFTLLALAISFFPMIVRDVHATKLYQWDYGFN